MVLCWGWIGGGLICGAPEIYFESAVLELW